MTSSPSRTVVIADIVHSRQLVGHARSAAQRGFLRLVRRLNDVYAAALVAAFTVSRGDEFQGLLSDATILPDLVWTMEQEFPEALLHVGVGRGVVDTPVSHGANVLELDGPAFHNARAAVEDPRSSVGGVFLGFGRAGDEILNGFARLLARHRHELSERQRQILGFAREGANQTAIAKRIKKTRQAVSDHFRAAKVEAYLEAESGWRSALDLLTRSSEGLACS